ncbi:hypothetical protein SAMN02744133_11488 [Thalassospira xiamenensis M-5 = DSM 17429]|uniref:Secreted protein n=1 Tax=Thalassospira xiamenensis M-5 = DSM 17429 TaxID=1123366 RepID=A0AB72UG53_9PROT|nr:hypothetical protein [Thalassospira xiamenensis]AJD53024.1 hypothetical protein TH3_14590 [Thalassospira xiamenensis M-5 = DSM 17429]SIT29158.1 hypothetical protein SAMN02744133_11488 [Thalassospira xiamenensis M-5 = DSM 17429]
MISIAKLPSLLLLAMTIFCGFMAGDGRDAFAATTTITCTNLAAANASTSHVAYDDSDGTCVAANNENNSTALRDIVFQVRNSNLSVEQFRIGTGGSSDDAAHRGCRLGAFNAAAGASCTNDRENATNETATVTIDGENGATIRMTVNYTLVVGGGYDLQQCIGHNHDC